MPDNETKPVVPSGDEKPPVDTLTMLTEKIVTLEEKVTALETECSNLRKVNMALMSKPANTPPQVNTNAALEEKFERYLKGV